MNNANKIKYTCCFCNVGIEITKTDPGEVIISANFYKPIDQQQNQSFFCHLACFQERLHDNIKNYFYLPDILED